MKKIIMKVAIAAMGVAVNAATVNWNVNAIQSSPDNSVGAGWIVQVYSSSVAYDYASAKAGTLTTYAQAATVAAGTTFRGAGSVADGLANGTSGTFYAVIYDASSIASAQNYIVSDTVTVTATAAGNPVTLNFGAMSATTTANKFLNSSWTSTTAVPEPTSGLLLLLGMAGLALKRKRA